MIRHILKLWSSNDKLFNEARELCEQKIFDGIELYNDVSTQIGWSSLEAVKDKVITIHNPHSHGWHDFWFTPEQISHWEQTKKLADFFHASRIVVHPARTHNLETFLENFEKIKDTRVIIENMAGIDINGRVMEFGQSLADLKEIKKKLPICFDFTKAMLSSSYQRIDYKKYIEDCVNELQPDYFHISGADSSNTIDQHLNIWEGSIDVHWLKTILNKSAKEKDIFLVFETPKLDGLSNDKKNLDFFLAS